MRGWYVYLLHCRGDRLYCGVTTDLAARTREHMRGTASRFTRAFPPTTQGVVWVGGPMERGDALRMELKIKKMKTAAKRRLADSETTEMP